MIQHSHLARLPQFFRADVPRLVQISTWAKTPAEMAQRTREFQRLYGRLDGGGEPGSAEPQAFDSPAPTKRLVRQYGVALVPGVGGGLLLFLNDHQELAEVDAGCGISPLVA